MDGLLEKKAYKDIVFDWAASHGFTPVESEINDLLWRLEKIVSGEASLTAPNPQPVSAALEALLATLKEDSDRAYCRMIDIADQKLRGIEYRVKNNQVTADDISNIESKSEYLGRHRGIVDASKAIKQALAQAGVPDGWVLVPKEPTEKMHDAGKKAYSHAENNWSIDGDTSIEATYKAMLAAAPVSAKEG